MVDWLGIHESDESLLQECIRFVSSWRVVSYWTHRSVACFKNTCLGLSMQHLSHVTKVSRNALSISETDKKIVGQNSGRERREMVETKEARGGGSCLHKSSRCAETHSLQNSLTFMQSDERHMTLSRVSDGAKQALSVVKAAEIQTVNDNEHNQAPMILGADRPAEDQATTPRSIKHESSADELRTPDKVSFRVSEEFGDASAMTFSRLEWANCEYFPSPWPLLGPSPVNFEIPSGENNTAYSSSMVSDVACSKGLGLEATVCPTEDVILHNFRAVGSSNLSSTETAKDSVDSSIVLNTNGEAISWMENGKGQLSWDPRDHRSLDETVCDELCGSSVPPGIPIMGSGAPEPAEILEETSEGVTFATPKKPAEVPFDKVTNGSIRCLWVSCSSAPSYHLSPLSRSCTAVAGLVTFSS